MVFDVGLLTLTLRERSSDDGFPALLLSPPKGVDLLPYPIAEVLGLNDQVRHSKAQGPWVQGWSLKGEAESSMNHSLGTVLHGSKSDSGESKAEDHAPGERGRKQKNMEP